MSFQPLVRYNEIYLALIGIVTFIIQVELLHLLRYHRTIAYLGAILANSMWELKMSHSPHSMWELVQVLCLLHVGTNNVSAHTPCGNSSSSWLIFPSEMTYIVSGGALNSTHSLTRPGSLHVGTRPSSLSTPCGN